jgi:hypothetical protein
LLAIGADLIAARQQRRQELAHDFEPMPDAADDQSIDYLPARYEVAVDLPWSLSARISAGSETNTTSTIPGTRMCRAMT